MKRADLLKLSQWLSPAYPVGAFSYSHGLEWLISQGEISTPAQLQSWLTDILTHGAGRNDAILLAHAYRADTPAKIAEVAELAVAFTPSKERLLETTAQGAAFAKTTRTIWPAALPDMPYPVAVGAAARQHGLPLADTTALYLHAFIANLVSAAVRFMPLGQTDGQAVLSAMAGLIDQTAEAAEHTPLDDLGGCALRADMASMLHETLHTRIFRT